MAGSLETAANTNVTRPAPKRLTLKGERTRAAILDAAERQFSERGYDGVSLRQIIDEAAVQMGQLQYYFPSKDDVFAGVLDRRLNDVLTMYAQSIEWLDQQVAAGPVTLRTILRTVMAASRAWLRSDDTGRHRYLRVLGLATMNFSQPDFVRRHGEVFRPLNIRIIAAIAALFPAASEDRVVGAYYLIEANLLSLYVNLDAILIRSNQPRTSEVVGRMYDELESFLVGGVEQLLGTPNPNA